MKKIIALMLVVLMLLSLAACGSEPVQTTASSPETTAKPATEATEMPIDNAAALHSALESDLFVGLGGDIILDTTAVVRGGELDGCGYTLTAPDYDEGRVETENGLTVTQGIVRNVTVLGGYRCIGDSGLHQRTGDVRLYNVKVQGDTYAMNFGYGKGNGSLWAEDCTVYGWCSYTGFDSARFENCTFGWGDSKGTANLRPYIDTVLSECRFESKTDSEGNVIPYNLTLRESISGIVITLENCYADGTLITEENIYTLLNVELYDNILRVYNTEE